MSPGFDEQSRKRLIREQEAEKYDEVVRALDQGRLEIRNASPAEVRDRLLDKASRARAGEKFRPVGRSFSPQSLYYVPFDQADDDQDEDAPLD